MTAAALAVRDLRIRRGAFTLAIAAWRAEVGSCVAVVGANGAGKTTFLTALSGRLGEIPYDGEVTLLGREIGSWDHRIADSLGLLPHAPVGLGYLRVREYLALCAATYEAWDPTRASALVEELRIDPALRLDELSEGSRRKFGLACLEAAGPPVLLLDEPTAALDIAARRTVVRAVLESRARDPRRTIVFASHEASDIVALADRLDVIAAGRLVDSQTLPPLDDLAARAVAVERTLEGLDRSEVAHA